MTYLNKRTKYLEAIVLYWVPVIVWAAAIFALSSVPSGTASEIDWQDFIIKKAAHVFVYFVLTGLNYRALLSTGVDKRKAVWISILTSVVYGYTDEVHQSFTPGRDPRIRDVVFDTIGAVLFIYTIWNILPIAPKRLRNLASELGLR